MPHPILNDTQAKMKKAVEHALHEFNGIHTGKANPAMVETISVEAYGSHLRIKDCAAISTPDPRMIVVQPWDKGLMQAIIKGIQTANLGLNPNADGAVIRIPLPDMSRERRQEFVKVAQRLAEEGRIQVRSVRHDALSATKRAKFPEDESKRLEKDIQTATDKSIEEINRYLAAKEKELTTV